MRSPPARSARSAPTADPTDEPYREAPEAELSAQIDLSRVVELVCERVAAPEERADGVYVGRIEAVDDGTARVSCPLAFAGAPRPVRAIVSIEAGDVGREVAVAFEAANAARPLVLGFMARPTTDLRALTVREEADHLVVSVDRPLEVRVGKASVKLTPDGKVHIKGESVLVRATETNRIQGGAVRIN